MIPRGGSAAAGEPRSYPGVGDHLGPFACDESASQWAYTQGSLMLSHPIEARKGISFGPYSILVQSSVFLCLLDTIFAPWYVRINSASLLVLSAYGR